MTNDKTSGNGFSKIGGVPTVLLSELPETAQSTFHRPQDAIAHVFTGDRELHDAIYQSSPGDVFVCGNHALVAQGQHLAGVWSKKELKFELAPEDRRIPEPPTYADIRKD
jgi:hypothetical protein